MIVSRIYVAYQSLFTNVLLHILTVLNGAFQCQHPDSMNLQDADLHVSSEPGISLAYVGKICCSAVNSTEKVTIDTLNVV